MKAPVRVRRLMSNVIVLWTFLAAMAVLFILVPKVLAYLIGGIAAVLILNGVYHLLLAIWRGYLKVLQLVFATARTILPRL